MARAEEARSATREALADDVDPAAIRWFDPVTRPIERATDLGSVQVIKHGDLFLMTDPFGDVHVDSRGLGLYDRDTRLLSCSQVRVNGARPVLLQGTAGGNFRATIQLTNPSIDRNIEAKVNPLDDLSGRKVGIARDRMLSLEGLEERLMVENYAEHPETVTIELELGIDGADIFEVRGRLRDQRGTLHPAAVLPARATFRYDGLDGRRRSTHLRFSGPADEIEPVEVQRDGSERRGLVAPPLDLAACSRPAAGAALGRVGDRHQRRDHGRQSGRSVPGCATDRRGRAKRRVPRLDEEHGRGGHRPRAVQPHRVALRGRPPAADQRDTGRG